MSASPRPHRHARDDDGAPAASGPSSSVFVLDRAAVGAVDRTAIDEYGIPGIVLMENAARGLADVARQLLGAPADARPPLIACGGGNNGGDGYALARHLHNSGYAPTLATLSAPRPGSDAALNADICRRMGIARVELDEQTCVEHDGLVVDALLGTGLDRAVTGHVAVIIDAINRSARPVLAVDVPSGLDCDTGRPLGTSIRAVATVTFVGLKPGFLELDAQPFLGEVTVVDIGAPIELLRRYGRPIRPGPPE